MSEKKLNEDIEMITEWPVTQNCDTKLTSKTVREEEESVNKPDSRHLKHTLPDSIEECSTKRIRNADKTETKANTALAKWWRHNLHKMGDNELPKDCNPNTLISLIARLPDAKEFMQGEIIRLKHKLRIGWITGDVHVALGSFLEKVDDLEQAVYHYEEAVKLEPNEKEYRWLLHKGKRILEIRQIQKRDLKKIKDIAMFPSSIQVEKRSSRDLTVADFYKTYECTSTPVIITDQKFTSVPWSLEHIEKIAGRCHVTLKKPIKFSVEWARLENNKIVSVSSYIKDIRQRTLVKPLYLFDWSLPINCPDLVKELIIPKYFAGDFLQRTNEGSLYRDSWPSLFIAPEGITSELHVDAFGSNFWMALLQGKKRWIFFPKSNVPYLYPKYEYSFDPVFGVDLSKPDMHKHPLLHLTTPIECILQPGEILFVPAGCPHRVENLETTVAISSNFVDRSNFGIVKHELETNSLVDPRSQDLLRQFSDKNFNDRMNMDIKDKTFCEFKIT